MVEQPFLAILLIYLLDDPAKIFSKVLDDHVSNNILYIARIHHEKIFEKNGLSFSGLENNLLF